MNSATLTLDTTQDAGRAVHGTVRPLVLPSVFSQGDRAYAQHVRNCAGVGVWPDSPEAWANRPWHRRQNSPICVNTGNECSARAAGKGEG
jgi:hypothetical protein